MRLSLNLRLKVLLGPVTRVEKKKKKCWRYQHSFLEGAERSNPGNPMVLSFSGNEF